MNPLENPSPASSPRPEHMGREYAEQFQDQSVVDVYHLRPPYPDEVFSILARLVDPNCRRVLDVGCGTGGIARQIAAQVAQVDAVDFSPAMIVRGKQLPGGDAPNLCWIEGEVETVALTPPYGLITAASSLHWMEWRIVMPRFAQILTPEGMLAIILEHSSPAELELEPLWKLVRDYATNRHYQPYDLIEELTQRELFTPEGEQWTMPVSFEQSVTDYIESFHARNGFSRERMSAEAAQAFDTQGAQILNALCPTGQIVLSVQARIVWGKPGH